MKLSIEPRHEEWLTREWETGIKGWSSDIAPFYAALAEALPNGCRLLEIGVHEGRSLLFFAHLRRVAGHVDVLHGVDPVTGEARDRFYQHRDRLGLGETVRLVTAWSAEYSLRVPARLYDVVFIDGGHEYRSVREDILAYQDKVRSGGILAGHDYGNDVEWPGVRVAVDELLPLASHYRSCWWVTR